QSLRARPVKTKCCHPARSSTGSVRRAASSASTTTRMTSTNSKVRKACLSKGVFSTTILRRTKARRPPAAPLVTEISVELEKDCGKAYQAPVSKSDAGAFFALIHRLACAATERARHEFDTIDQPCGSERLLKTRSQRHINIVKRQRQSEIGKACDACVADAARNDAAIM